MLTHILGHHFGADSGPGERSGWIDTGNLQEIAARTLWDYSRGPKPENMSQQKQKHVGFAGFPGRNYYLLIINPAMGPMGVTCPMGPM